MKAFGLEPLTSPGWWQLLSSARVGFVPGRLLGG